MSSPRMKADLLTMDFTLVRSLHPDMHRLLFFTGLLVATLASPSNLEHILRQGGNTENLPNNSNDSVFGNPCTCTGPICQCCVDFNMTYVDLGGPGCVSMKYLSKDNGILVNVSYGDSQLHGGEIKVGDDSVTCMDLLLELAQMCARFTDVALTDEGMKACANLEPTLLGDPQDAFHLGCFVMGPEGMKLVNSSKAVPEITEEPVQETEEKPDVSEEALIAAVNESAEEGIAWFSSFLGLSFGKATNETKPSSGDSSVSSTLT